jgi:SpoVK/Ycf46/Vps4 family AAA+-type ATPase
MQTVLEPDYADPSYNGDVVAELNELATLDQYWRERRTRYEESLERQKEHAEDPAAEREWLRFCSDGTGFLKKYKKKAVASLGSPLRHLWIQRAVIAREAQNIIETEASTEIWIPFSLTPLKFVCLGQRSPLAEIRQLPHSDRSESFALGKPHMMIRCGDTYLFMVLPTGAYATLNEFAFTKEGVSWNTQEVLPKVFAEALPEFRPYLATAERLFAPIRASWDVREQITRGTRQLERLAGSVAAWRRVRIPDEQKLDILRRMELFEITDPAAPHGLLLSGPTGTGKSLIARTIAETTSCDFQKLSLPDLKQENLGASGRRVREIWDHARSHRPAIIFVDECDSVFGRRGAAESDVVATEVVNAFLPEWDGIEQTSGIMVIGATNRRDSLDDAIISRFGWESETPNPGNLERKRILEQELKANGVLLPLPDDIGTSIQGMSGRDIRNLAASTKSLSHPDAPTIEHLYEAAKAARKRGSARVGHAWSWETLAIDALSLERLQLICALLRDAERWSSQNVTIPRNLLLTGHDAGLKSQLAQALANESGLTLLAPTLSDLKARVLGESGNRVKSLFERARSTAPAILFLDRLENVAPNRGMAGAMDPLTNEIIGQLIQECERIQNTESHIFLLGSASNLEQVDPAVLDCFHEEMAIGLPGGDARAKLFTQFLADKKISFPLADGALLLAQLTERQAMASRDVENLVRSAEQKALLRAVRNGGPEHYSIVLEDFELSSRPS